MHIGILEGVTGQQALYALWLSRGRHACTRFASVKTLDALLKKVLAELAPVIAAPDPLPAARP